ncbi:MAG: PD40 domain-containing protein [Gemmatimonadaceae bacterium]|nr:PD40 domain-containing protein [Gemmatimonadaceae bacterium]
MPGDRYASEYWAAPSPDGKTLAITARGTVVGQWWRHGHSHLDESEIWLVKGLETGTPTYEAFGASGGAKEAWPMWAPDGNAVYYVSDQGGQENLWAQPMGPTSPSHGRQMTHFTNGRALAADRARRQHHCLRTELRHLALRCRQGRASEIGDHAARRICRGERGTADAVAGLWGARRLARRTQGGVRGARRCVRRGDARWR